MDMNVFLVDAYFTEHSPKAKFMMGSSDPDSLSLSTVMQDFSKFSDEKFEYALGNGYLLLRQRLSKLYKTISADQISILNGGEEGIYVTMRALLKQGDEIVIHMPSYQSLFVIAKEMGCSLVEYRPKFEDDWKFNIHDLQEKITPKTKVLILNYPHNPTGACLTDKDMEEIVQLCRKYNLYLIADEVYRFLRLDENCSDASFADLYEKAIVLGSFSKAFASPGLRLGWIASKNPELMEKILAYRHFTSTCPNLPCQWIASELLKKSNAIIQRNNDIVRYNADLLKTFIREHSNLFAYVPPKGATMAYVRLLGNQSAQTFCQEILENTGVLIVPSSVLENSDEYLRIGLCRKSFPKCIELLNNYLSC